MSYLNDLEEKANNDIIDPLVNLAKTSLMVIGIGGAGYAGLKIYQNTGGRKLDTLTKNATKATAKLETAKTVAAVKDEVEKIASTSTTGVNNG